MFTYIYCKEFNALYYKFMGLLEGLLCQDHYKKFRCTLNGDFSCGWYYL